MYDVAPFTKPVPFDFERTVEVVGDDKATLENLRRARSQSNIGEMMREHLGIA